MAAIVINSNIVDVQAGVTAGKLRTVDFSGKVRMVTGLLVPPAGVDPGSIINLVKLPKGARVLPESKLYFEAGQLSALTVSVGDGSNSSRYLASKVVGTSAITIVLDGAALDDHVMPEADYVKITNDGSTLVAGKKIAFVIYYVVD